MRQPQLITASIACTALMLLAASAHAQPASFADAKLLWTLPWDADWVTAVTFVGNDKIVAGNKLGEILVWNLPAPGAKAPPPVRRLAGHTNDITRMLTTPDRKTILSASLDHTIKYWDALATAGEPGSVILNERARDEAQTRKRKVPDAVEAKVMVQKCARELTGHKDWVQSISMTPDGRFLVSGADRAVGPKKAGELIVWDLPAGKEISRWHTKGWPWGLAIAPDGQTVIASERLPLYGPDRLSALRLWNVQTGTVKADLSKDVKEPMAAAAFSADGKWLALCRGGEANGLSGKTTLLDPATGKKIRETSPGHLDGGTDLAFHPDGKHIFSSGRDTLVKIWRLEDGKLVRDIGKSRGGQSKDWICAIAISPDGTRLACGDMAGQVHIWALHDALPDRKAE